MMFSTLKIYIYICSWFAGFFDLGFTNACGGGQSKGSCFVRGLVSCYFSLASGTRGARGLGYLLPDYRCMPVRYSSRVRTHYILDSTIITSNKMIVIRLLYITVRISITYYGEY